MIDKIDAGMGSSAFARPGTTPPGPIQQSHVKDSNGFQFFGKDGFTFFDFLDVINPLQHIPVVSTLYRSITGDSIDPGAKIAGGTLFGGPLGAALSSLDVAVKHSTGRDITDHTVAFFTETTDNQNTLASGTTGLETAALGPAQMRGRSSQSQASVSGLQPIEAGLPTLAVDTMRPPPQKTYITEERFRAAGMSAIPVAKRPFSGDSRGVTVAPRPLPDLGLLGDIARTAAPHVPLRTSKGDFPMALSPHAPNNEVAKARQKQSAAIKPLRLTPKFSATNFLVTASEKEQPQPVIRTPPVAFLTANDQAPDPIQAITQTLSHTKNDWVLNAMRQGLDKYKSANSLAADTSQNPAVSVRR
ncbi:MAG: hypothetical protein P8J29_00410 [Rhodospirillales bacterium]|nr:hypothetical protein [Rhodospirillales bacterium]